MMENKSDCIQKHWELTAPPFDNVPNPDLFYPSTIHQEGLLRIRYAIEARKGAAMLTGEIGSGKTMLSRLLIQKLPQTDYEIALINNPNFSRISFLKELCYQMGIGSGSSDRDKLLHRINDRLLENFENGKDTIIIIDEAQAIGNIAVFEELRLLLNFQLNDRFLATLIILGQPELQKTITKLHQFEQRIAVKYHLGPLDVDDTGKYIDYRIKRCNSESQIFNPNVIKFIHNNTNGIPRLINNLCDLCLLSGYIAKAETIDISIVEKVISDEYFKNYAEK